MREVAKWEGRGFIIPHEMVRFHPSRPVKKRIFIFSPRAGRRRDLAINKVCFRELAPSDTAADICELIPE